MQNSYGVPPLSIAAANGNANIVALLLDAGADREYGSARRRNGSHVCGARGQPRRRCRTLLAKGADPNAREEREQTALMWAAAEGHAAVVAALLDAGADLHAKLESGFTPIFFAAREGHIEVVRTLLEAGADVNELLERVKGGADLAVNNASYRPVDEGMSLLLLAVRNGHFELAIELVKAGADPNDQRTGFTPLHTVSWVRKPDKSDRGDPAPIGSGDLTSLEFVREIVKLGADVNLRLADGAPRQPNSASSLNSAGATPFLLAADRSDVALMRLLLELGADPYLANFDNSSPLMAAAGLGTTSPEEEGGTEPEALIATELLLDLGADVNAVNSKGDTAMHGAASGGFPTVVQLLADRGADIHVWNQSNDRGSTPLFIAEGYREGATRRSPADDRGPREAHGQCRRVHRRGATGHDRYLRATGASPIGPRRQSQQRAQIAARLDFPVTPTQLSPTGATMCLASWFPDSAATLPPDLPPVDVT